MKYFKNENKLKYKFKSTVKEFKTDMLDLFLIACIG
jgi:hypothetical protein